jgi:hypothetical protein
MRRADKIAHTEKEARFQPAERAASTQASVQEAHRRQTVCGVCTGLSWRRADPSAH